MSRRSRFELLRRAASGKHAAGGARTIIPAASLLLALPLVLLVLICCVAVPAFAWMSSSFNLTLTGFTVPANDLAVTVVSSADAAPVADTASDDEAFTFTAELQKEYDVTVESPDATNDKVRYITVAVGGMEKTYVSRAILVSEDVVGQDLLTFHICLSAEDVADGDRVVVITPHWGAFEDFDAIDKYEGLAQLTDDARIGTFTQPSLAASVPASGSASDSGTTSTSDSATNATAPSASSEDSSQSTVQPSSTSAPSSSSTPTPSPAG